MIQVAVLLTGVHTGHSDIARITLDLPTFCPRSCWPSPGLRAGLRRCPPQGRRGRQGEDLRQGRRHRHRVQRGPRPGRPGAAAHREARALRPAGLRQDPGRPRRSACAGRSPVAPRSAPARPLLPRHRRDRARGLRPDRDHGGHHREHPCGATDRLGRSRPPPASRSAIADDGEVLVRGGHVFRGYWKNEAATAEVIDADGWFHTGDLGSLDSDGYLTITGRKKEILVTSAGKNVSPAPLEDIIRAHPLVSQALVLGDDRPQIIGPGHPRPRGAVAAWLAAAGPTGHAGRRADQGPGLLDDVAGRPSTRPTPRSRSAEQIKKFRVLPRRLHRGRRPPDAEPEDEAGRHHEGLRRRGRGALPAALTALTRADPRRRVPSLRTCADQRSPKAGRSDRRGRRVLVREGAVERLGDRRVRLLGRRHLVSWDLVLTAVLQGRGDVRDAPPCRSPASNRLLARCCSAKPTSSACPCAPAWLSADVRRASATACSPTPVVHVREPDGSCRRAHVGPVGRLGAVRCPRSVDCRTSPIATPRAAPGDALARLRAPRPAGRACAAGRRAHPWSRGRRRWRQGVPAPPPGRSPPPAACGR